MGLTQLQRAYKRQLTDLYDADDEDEVTPSRKRQRTAPADGDTRVVVEYRCDSPPPNQEALELPWGPLYQSSSESESECVVITRTRPHYHHEEDEDAIVSAPPAKQEAELPWGPVELLSDSDSTVVVHPQHPPSLLRRCG